MSKENWPCRKYKVSLTGVMGTCECGWLQADHKPARRKFLRDQFKSGGAAATESGEDNVERSEKKKQPEPCSTFKIDVDMGFQLCSCGWDKGAHDEAARKRAAEAALSKDMIASMRIDQRKLAMEAGHPCAEFEVDLANAEGGYGLCLCGFSRQDHMKFSQVPEEWLQAQAELTPPKEFT
mmetsp:Transcript_6310/g.7674  ORF Transcript_6310/g.7674 Transcript_6310/m.7674 type:complete len:180 (+) Transcript_6310:245-784(+)